MIHFEIRFTLLKHVQSLQNMELQREQICGTF